MSQNVLEAELRTKLGKGPAHRLRVAGKIPGVYYGGEKNLHVAVDPNALEKVVSGEMGSNVMITLKVDGGEHTVLLKDHQAHAINRKFTHVDFIKVDPNKKIHVQVPVHLTGKCIGVKEGGILDQTIRELDLICLPGSIPKEVIVDITNLKKGESIHLADVKLPAGTEHSIKADVVIAAVVLPREEKVKEEGEGVTAEAATEGAEKKEDAKS